LVRQHGDSLLPHLCQPPGIGLGDELDVRRDRAIGLRCRRRRDTPRVAITIVGGHAPAGLRDRLAGGVTDAQSGRDRQLAGVPRRRHRGVGLDHGRAVGIAVQQPRAAVAEQW
jgi:hypothetical protein